MTHPNTVAHSSGAVVCPDEASARRHRDRATWWQAGTIRVRNRPDGRPALHATRAHKRWTR